MIYLATIFVFIIGASIGSFLNVLIFRLPAGIEVFRRRSFCPYCKTPLKTFQLVPIFSYFLLGGKCKTCGKSISFQYPAVEAATAILFAASFISWSQKFSGQSQFLPQLLLSFLVISVLIVVFVIDLKHGIIPDQVVKIALIGAIILVFANYFSQTLTFFLNLANNLSGFDKYLFPPVAVSQLKFSGLDFATRLAAGLGVLVFFTILILVTRGRGLGWGDVKFGFFLGFVFSAPEIFQVLFLSFVIGAFVSLILVILKLKKFGQTVPFGPFLSIASLATLFFGDKIFNWYFLILA